MREEKGREEGKEGWNGAVRRLRMQEKRKGRDQKMMNRRKKERERMSK